MKKVGIAAAAALVLALIVWYLQPKSKASIEAPIATRVRIAQVGDFFLYAPLYVAQDAGFFAKHGLAVEIISTGGDDKSWAAVLSGDALAGIGDPTFVAISAQRGVGGRVIASIVDGVPFWGVALDSTIRVADDGKGLRGHTVATFPAPSTAYALQRAMFLDAKIKPAIREGSFGALIGMLKARQVDIALELEPNVSTAVAGGAHVVYSLAQHYGSFAITGLTTTIKNVEAHPTELRGVVCALQDAMTFIRANRDSSLQILEKRFATLPKTIAEAALARSISEGVIPASAGVSDSAWQKAVKLRQANGELPRDSAFADALDMRFVAACASTK